jgi:PAS domain S-box-containing protein
MNQKIVGIIFFVFLLFVGNYSFTEPEIDSLETLLPQSTGIEKASILLKLAHEYRVKEPRKTVDYASQALNIAIEADSIFLKHKAYSSLGLGYRYLGEYDKAIEYQERALEIATLTGEKSLIALEYNRIGIIYKKWGLYSKALEYYLKALSLREKYGSKGSIANMYNNIGNVYRKRGDLKMALEYYFKTLDIRKELDDREGYAYILNNIGNVYSDLMNYNEALIYHQESLKVKKELGNDYGVSISYSNLGNVYLAQNRFEKALENFQMALAISENASLKDGISTNLTDIGRTYRALKDYDKAQKYLSDALKIKEEIGDKSGIIYSYISFSDIYLDLNREKQALNYLKKAEKMAKEEGFLNYQSSIYENYYKLYNSQNNYKEALKYYIKYSVIHDSIFNNEISNKITELQIKQRTKTVETQNSLLEEKNKVQELSINKKNQFIISLVAITFLILVLIGLIYSRYLIKHKAQRELLEKNKSITEQKNFLEAFINTIPNPMFFMDKDGKYQGCNSAFRKIHERDNDEIIGKTVFDLYPKGLATTYHKSNVEMLTKGKSQQMESKVILPKNKWLDVIFYKNAFYDSNGEVAGLLGIMLDITERKRAEDKLKSSEKQLRVANVAKDKFFSIIAHDLTNPLNAIMGLAGLLHDEFEYFDNNEKKEVIENLYNATQSTFKLLQNLLEWSKAQIGKLAINPETLNMSTIATENITLLSSMAHSKEIKLKSTIPFNAMVVADSNLITTVVRNLISNSIKFTPKGGDILISSERINGHLEICVKDTGVGIEPENLEKLFSIEKQFRTKGTEGEYGSGLGLMLCKEFIEKNKGKIWAESEIGKGTRVKFTLPV